MTTPTKSLAQISARLRKFETSNYHPMSGELSRLADVIDAHIAQPSAEPGAWAMEAAKEIKATFYSPLIGNGELAAIIAKHAPQPLPVARANPAVGALAVDIAQCSHITDDPDVLYRISAGRRLASVPTECLVCKEEGKECGYCAADRMNAQRRANPPQVDATLEGIAQELLGKAEAQRLMLQVGSAVFLEELAERLYAHARKSQPGVNEELKTCLWLMLDGTRPDYSDSRSSLSTRQSDINRAWKAYEAAESAAP